MDLPEVILKLEEMFSSPEFTGTIGDFLASAALQFAFFDLEAEQPLAHYQLYEAYQELVEKVVESFLAQEGISSEQLFEELRRIQKDG